MALRRSLKKTAKAIALFPRRLLSWFSARFVRRCLGVCVVPPEPPLFAFTEHVIMVIASKVYIGNVHSELISEIFNRFMLTY